MIVIVIAFVFVFQLADVVMVMVVFAGGLHIGSFLFVAYEVVGMRREGDEAEYILNMSTYTASLTDAPATPGFWILRGGEVEPVSRHSPPHASLEGYQKESDLHRATIGRHILWGMYAGKPATSGQPC